MSEEIHISSLINPNQIILNLLSDTKNDIIKELAAPLFNTNEIKDQSKFLNEIFEREEKGSTGIGGGIAIPHCRTDEVSNIMISVAFKKDGVDFESIDDIKAQVFFLLAIPKAKMQTYIMIISKLTRILNSSGVKDSLLSASTTEEVINIFNKAEENLQTK